MKGIIENRAYVVIAIVCLLSALGYAFSIMDEPRMADGALEFSEASIGEIILIMLAPISGISTCLLACVHAFKHGRKFWGVMSIAFWPLGFVYALLASFVWASGNNV